MNTMKNIILIGLLLGMKSLSFGQSIKAMDDYLNDVYIHHIAPGFSAVVVKDDKCIFSKGYGVEKINATKKFTAHTVSAIGSLTKSMTALAMLQLVEQGKVDLNSAVIKYLPWFRTANKDKSDKITIRMLLNHTSGIYGDATPTYDLTDKSTESLVRALNGIYLTREPGMSYEYSNLGYSIAGLVIHKVSGSPYTKFLEANIFKPLNMVSSTANPDEFEKLSAIYGHYYGIDKGIAAARNKQSESGEYIPAGSFTYSTASDLGKYLIALLSAYKGGSKGIVSEKSLQTMWAHGIKIQGISKEDGGTNADTYYGLGWMITTIENRKIIYHQGSTGTMSSCTMIDVENKTAATMLFNIDVTLCDKYRFLPDINMVNNLLRLALGLHPSAFGMTKMPDPTKAKTTRIPVDIDKFPGNYSAAGGGLSLLNGARIIITKTENKNIELTALRGNDIIYKCNLDFINESYAFSRNLLTSTVAKFKVNPQGIVSGLYFLNSEFIKRDQPIGQNAITMRLQNLKITLSLKDNWNAQGIQNYFEAGNKGNSAIQLYGVIDAGKYNTADAFIAKYLNHYNLTNRGVPTTQTIGNQVWQQIALISENNKEKWQHYVVSSSFGKNKVFIVLTTPANSLTSEIQSSLNPLLESVSIQ